MPEGRATSGGGGAAMDLIVPLCAPQGPEREHRVRNLELLWSTLPSNVHLLLVEQRRPGRDTLSEELLRRRSRSGDPAPTVVYADHDGPFNKGWLYNIGVAEAETESIILGESDVVAPPLHFERLLQRIRRERLPWSFCWDRIVYLSEDRTTSVRDDVPRSGGPEGGLVYFDRAFYRAIGGANEWLEQLGGIDNELIRRAEHASGVYPRMTGTIYHYYHPESPMKGATAADLEQRQKNRRVLGIVASDPGAAIRSLSRFRDRMGGRVPLSTLHDVTELLSPDMPSPDAARGESAARPAAPGAPVAKPSGPVAQAVSNDARTATEPAVAVILTTCDCAATVMACLESVRQQTHRNLHLVVVDDASSDATPKTLAGYRELARDVVVEPVRKGLSAARNLGLRRIPADARYVMFLDGRDSMSPDFIERCVGVLEGDGDAGLAYAEEVDMDPAAPSFGTRLFLDAWDLERWLRWVRLRGLPWLGRRELVEGVGPHDETMPCAGELDFLLRLLARSAPRAAPKAELLRGPTALPAGARAREWARCYASVLVKHGVSEDVAIAWTGLHEGWSAGLKAGIARGMELRAELLGEPPAYHPLVPGSSASAHAAPPPPVPAPSGQAVRARPRAAPAVPPAPRPPPPPRLWTTSDLAVNGGAPVRHGFLADRRPCVGPFEIEAVTAVIRSGWLGGGPKVAELEAQLAAFAGARHAVAVGSGTAALFLCLLALGVGGGDQVVTSALTSPSTALAIARTGATPVFADIDPRDLTLDPAAVAAALTPATKAVIAVHLGGQPCDLARLRDATRDAQIPIVEDAAHALGARYRGVPVGGTKGLACFSLGENAIVSAGSGGFITLEDAGLAAQIRLLRGDGSPEGAWQRAHEPGARAGRTQILGTQLQMSDVAAALALSQLPRQAGLLEVRRHYAERYDEAFAKLPIARQARPAKDGADVHALHAYLVLLEPGRWRVGRDRVVEALRKENIGAAAYVPVHEHPYHRDSAPPAGLERTDDVGARLFTLPLSAGMTDSDVADVITAVEKVAAIFAKG